MGNRGGYRVAATSKMENGFQPLNIILKCFILDVPAVLDPPLRIKLSDLYSKIQLLLLLFNFYMNFYEGQHVKTKSSELPFRGVPILIKQNSFLC